MASPIVVTSPTTSRVNTSEVNDSNVGRLLNKIDGWRIARKALSQRRHPMTKATMRKEAHGIAEQLHEVAIEADVLLTNSALSLADFEDVMALHKRSEKILRRLRTLAWEMKVENEVRRLYASALALHLKNRKIRKQSVN